MTMMTMMMITMTMMNVVQNQRAWAEDAGCSQVVWAGVEWHVRLQWRQCRQGALIDSDWLTAVIHPNVNLKPLCRGCELFWSTSWRGMSKWVGVGVLRDWRWDGCCCTGRSCRPCRCYWPSGMTLATWLPICFSARSFWIWRQPTCEEISSGMTFRNTISTSRTCPGRVDSNSSISSSSSNNNNNNNNNNTNTNSNNNKNNKTTTTTTTPTTTTTTTTTTRTLTTTKTTKQQQRRRRRRQQQRRRQQHEH